MTGEARRGKTAAVSLLLLALSCVTVDGAIVARKNRRDVPQKITFSEAKQLLQRQKRAASNTPPGSENQGQVLLNEVVLNGSENHSYAYVHWSGKETSDVVFILAVQYNYNGSGPNGLVWRSEDYGSSYTKYTFGKDAHVSYFYVSPANASKMVFVDTQHKCMYRTDNELKTFRNVSMPVASDDVYMHPNNSDWMLLYDYYKKDLYVTMDFGTSWNLLQSDVHNFDWAIMGYEDPGIVHIEVHPWDSVDSYYKRCTIPDCNSTGDGLDTALGPFLSDSLHVVNEFILVQKVLVDGSDSHMMVSHRRGNFSNAYFPGNVKTQDFLVLDATEGQVFLAVNHGNRKGASLYLSDPTGRYYVLSLENVHHRSFGHWFDVDMHKVEGLNGIYLANQQLKSNSNHLKSLISFDKGGNWQAIPSPVPHCNSDNCSLVLRLDMDNYFRNWILSEERAPGLIIAHGHYGRTYELNWSNLTVFTSSDGGWKWKDSSLKGVYHFNILDQGSIITAIKTGYRENTSQVYYSYDEGFSWHGDHFRNETLHVNGVLNEPNINTVVLSVYGHVNRFSPWTMVKLNFSKVLSKKCDNASDYGHWSPSDHDKTVKENCILGQEVSYKRKKPKAVCFNGEDFVHTVKKKACDCTEEDFECDFGFRRKGNECEREPWFNDGYIAPQCIEQQTYNKSRGYRKVGSDKCVGGVANQSKYQIDSSTKCPLVKPAHLLLKSNLTVVSTGQPVLFHLLQKSGSVHTTQYAWNFSDRSNVTVTGLQNAQHQTHVFWRQGLYEVKVTASNGDGGGVSNVVRVRAEYPINRVGIFHPWAVRVGVPVTLSASTNVGYSTHTTSLHYLYRFGDEASVEKDLLTYRSNISHTYNSSGTFTLSVTAVNSISAATKQVTLTVIDQGIVARLTFSSNVERLFNRFGRYYYYESVYFWLERFRQEMTMMVGIDLDRLALSLNSSHPVRIDTLIVPTPPNAPPGEMTAEQIAQAFTDMVDNQTLSLFQTSPYIKWFGEINVTAIQIMDFTGGGNGSRNHTDDGKHGGGGGGGDHKDGKINYRAIYIAVPVVVAAGIVTVVVIIFYRRCSRAHRYSLLNQDGAADPFFDEEDDLPLDMSDARDTGSSRDDSLLDLRSGN